MKRFGIKKISYVFTGLIILLSVLFSCQNKTQKKESKSEKNMITNTMTAPDWTKDLVIYEVNLRQYTDEGTIKAFIEHLPRLKSLGAGILWIMPVQPIGEMNRKGSMGSYYAIKDYLSVNPEFGTIEDFKLLVSKAHELGMYVILDWVANHTAWDNELTFMHPEFYTKDSLGSFKSPVPDWSDVIELDYSNNNLRKYMADAMKFWIQEADIDGFRCDVAGMVPTDFWDSTRVELEKEKHVFMLAEAEQKDLHEKAFNMSYTWKFHHICNDIAKGEKNAKDLVAYFNEELNTYSKKDLRMYFTTNHDENSWNGTVFERFGDSYQTFAALTYVLPGMPLIYSGQEAGLDKRLEFFEKDVIDWEKGDLSTFFKTYNQLKKDNKSLWCGIDGGEFSIIRNSSDEKIFSMIRQHKDEMILAVFNLSQIPVEFSLDSEIIIGEYTNLIDGSEMKIDTGKIISFKDWEYKILKRNN